MGNYNGTIRCGHCYNEGHNKRTCPDRLERLSRQYEQAKKSGGMSDYYGRQLAKMTGANPETGEKTSRRYEGRGRTCSYCKESGHNRRKCDQLGADITRYAALTATCRAEQRALMLEQGIGVGAMVQTRSYGDGGMYLVEAVVVNHVHPKNKQVHMRLRPLKTSLRPVSVAIRPDPEQSSYSGYKVVAPINSEQVAKCLPAGWETQPLDIKDEQLQNNPFEKGQARDYWYWKEIDVAEGE